MNWFLIGILAPFFWSLTNFIDKYTIGRFYDGGIKTGYMLLSFNTFSTLMIPVVFVLANGDIGGFSFLQITSLFISSICFIAALFPYMHSLKAKDTSLIIPIFQVIPVFSLVLGFIFLDENIGQTQLFLGFLTIFWAILISVDLDKDLLKSRLDLRSLSLMLLACFIYGVGNVTFKAGVGDNEFWPALFWTQVGYALQGSFIMIFVRSARQEAFGLIKQHGFELIRMSALNSFFDTTATIAYQFAMFSAPIFLASIVNSFQPVFTFLMGLGLTILLPNLIKEDISRKILVQKITLIILIFTTAVAFNYSLR
ncbi:hypothetical protein GF389_05295 [Candidatus Dojkabacteria bacterium]|nr:hypothetical protein [Candidatus Dojkabacteria bacterium]